MRTRDVDCFKNMCRGVDLLFSRAGTRRENLDLISRENAFAAGKALFSLIEDAESDYAFCELDENLVATLIDDLRMTRDYASNEINYHRQRHLNLLRTSEGLGETASTIQREVAV